MVKKGFQADFIHMSSVSKIKLIECHEKTKFNIPFFEYLPLFSFFKLIS